jgi:hypothetical protein
MSSHFDQGRNILLRKKFINKTITDEELEEYNGYQEIIRNRQRSADAFFKNNGKTIPVYKPPTPEPKPETLPPPEENDWYEGNTNVNEAINASLQIAQAEEDAQIAKLIALSEQQY